MTDQNNAEQLLAIGQRVIAKIALTTRQLKFFVSGLSKAENYGEVGEFLAHLLKNQNLMHFRQKYPEDGMVEYYDKFFDGKLRGGAKQPTEFFKEKYLDNILADSFYLMSHMDCISIASDVKNGERDLSETLTENLQHDPSINKFMNILMDVKDNHLAELKQNVYVNNIKGIIRDNIALFIGLYDNLKSPGEGIDNLFSLKVPTIRKIQTMNGEIMACCTQLAWSADKYSADSFHDMVDFVKQRRPEKIMNLINLSEYIMDTMQSVDELFKMDISVKDVMVIGQKGLEKNPEKGFDERMVYKTQLRKLIDRFSHKIFSDFRELNHEIVSLTKPYLDQEDNYVSDVRKVRESYSMPKIVIEINSYIPKASNTRNMFNG